MHKRRWRVAAPSGVAAVNIGGQTIHCLLQMNGLCESRLDDENPASLVLMQIEGIIIDEYTMVDVRVWNAMKRILQTYPLDPSRRKPNAVTSL